MQSDDIKNKEIYQRIWHAVISLHIKEMEA